MVVERFAGRLRELRMEAMLSQQEMADRAGIKLGAVRDLEQGRNGPTWETVLALCEALGVSCEAFTVEPSADAPPATRGRPKKASDAEGAGQVVKDASAQQAGQGDAEDKPAKRKAR